MGDVWGRMALRLANAEHYPHDFGLYADRVRGFLDALAAAPGVAGQVDLASARAAEASWRAEAVRLETALRTTLAQAPSAARTARLARMNEAMRRVEQSLLSAEGIPGRPWFKHVLYAPKYTYAAMTLPGVQEAVDAQDWARARAQVTVLAARLQAAAAATRAAARADAPPR